MIDSKLLNVLACPSCKGDIEYSAKESRITCQYCGLIYPVVDNIPVMIIEKAVNYEEILGNEKDNPSK